MEKGNLKNKVWKRVVAQILVLVMALGMIPGISFVAEASDTADADTVANQLTLLDFNMHAATLEGGETGRAYNGQYSGTTLAGKEIILKVAADATGIVSGNGVEINVGTPDNANKSGFRLEINKNNCLDVRNMIGSWSQDENPTYGGRLAMNQSLTELGINPGDEFELRIMLSFIDSDGDEAEDDAKLDIYVNDTEIYPDQIIAPNQKDNLGTYMGFAAPAGTMISFAPVYKAPVISVDDFSGQVFTPYKATVGSHNSAISAIGTYSTTSLVGTRFQVNVTPTLTSSAKYSNLYFAGQSATGWDGFWIRFYNKSNSEFILDIFDRLVNTGSGSALASINLTELGIAVGDTFLLELQLDLIATGEDGAKDDARLTARVENDKQCVAIVEGASSKLGNKMFLYTSAGDALAFEKVLAEGEKIELNETGKRLKLNSSSTSTDIKLNGTDASPSGGWSLNTYSYCGTDSGIYYNDILNTKISFRKIDDVWRMFLADGGITPATGDEITIRGAFKTYTQEWAVEFCETTLVYNGTAWEQDMKADEKNVLLFQYAPNKSKGQIDLTGLDFAPYDTTWATNIYSVNGSEHGVFLNGVKTEVYLRKVAENRWVVCLIDKNITPVAGDVITLKGQFIVGDYVIEFRQISMTYDGTNWAWSAVGTGVTGDANADNVTDVKDILRMKRYTTYENVSMDDSDINSDSAIDAQDVSLLREILIGKSEFSGGANVSLPDYSLSEAVIPLGAYAGPRKSGYEYWGTTKTNYRNNSYVTDEGFADYAATGLNFVFSEHDGIYENTEELQTYMQAAANNGVDVYAFSSTLTNILRSESNFTEENASFLSKMLDDLSKYKNFKGLMMADEPSYKLLDKYQVTAEYIRGILPDLKLYTSGYPMYVSSAAFSDDETVSLDVTYPAYINNLGNALGNFSYDFYPFRKVVDESGAITDYQMRSQWFQNLETVASTAKGKFDTGITIQSFGADNRGATANGEGYTGYRDLTKNDISFQVYSALAYGMKQITYFTYWEHFQQANDGKYTSAMIMWDDYTSSDSKPVKTDLYYAVQEVNHEILSFDHVFLNFDWKGTMSYKGSDSDGMLANLSDYSSPRIQSFTGDNDTIIGCLKDKKAHDGFMIVNATDPYDNKTAKGSITFKDATHALVYINGMQTTVSLTNGTYDYTLTPGQGIFVLPYIAK